MNPIEDAKSRQRHGLAPVRARAPVCRGAGRGPRKSGAQRGDAGGRNHKERDSRKADGLKSSKEGSKPLDKVRHISELFADQDNYTLQQKVIAVQSLLGCFNTNLFQEIHGSSLMSSVISISTTALVHPFKDLHTTGAKLAKLILETSCSHGSEINYSVAFIKSLFGKMLQTKHPSGENTQLNRSGHQILMLECLKECLARVPPNDFHLLGKAIVNNMLEQLSRGVLVGEELLSKQTSVALLAEVLSKMSVSGFSLTENGVGIESYVLELAQSYSTAEMRLAMGRIMKAVSSDNEQVRNSIIADIERLVKLGGAVGKDGARNRNIESENITSVLGLSACIVPLLRRGLHEKRRPSIVGSIERVIKSWNYLLENNSGQLSIPELLELCDLAHKLLIDALTTLIEKEDHRQATGSLRQPSILKREDGNQPLSDIQIDHGTGDTDYTILRDVKGEEHKEVKTELVVDMPGAVALATAQLSCDVLILLSSASKYLGTPLDCQSLLMQATDATVRIIKVFKPILNGDNSQSKNVQTILKRGIDLLWTPSAGAFASSRMSVASEVIQPVARLYVLALSNVPMLVNGVLNELAMFYGVAEEDEIEGSNKLEAVTAMETIDEACKVRLCLFNFNVLVASARNGFPRESLRALWQVTVRITNKSGSIGNDIAPDNATHDATGLLHGLKSHEMYARPLQLAQMVFASLLEEKMAGQADHEAALNLAGNLMHISNNLCLSCLEWIDRCSKVNLLPKAVCSRLVLSMVLQLEDDRYLEERTCLLAISIAAAAFKSAFLGLEKSLQLRAIDFVLKPCMKHPSQKVRRHAAQAISDAFALPITVLFLLGHLQWTKWRRMSLLPTKYDAHFDKAMLQQFLDFVTNGDSSQLSSLEHEGANGTQNVQKRSSSGPRILLSKNPSPAVETIEKNCGKAERMVDFLLAANLESVSSRDISSESDCLLARIQILSRMCVQNLLTSRYGDAAQTMEALEAALFKMSKDERSQNPHGGMERMLSELVRARCMLLFLFGLERNIKIAIRAGEGAKEVIDWDIEEDVKSFFVENSELCMNWLSRLRKNSWKLAQYAGMDALAVFHLSEELKDVRERDTPRIRGRSDIKSQERLAPKVLRSSSNSRPFKDKSILEVLNSTVELVPELGNSLSRLHERCAIQGLKALLTDNKRHNKNAIENIVEMLHICSLYADGQFEAALQILGQVGGSRDLMPQHLEVQVACCTALANWDPLFKDAHSLSDEFDTATATATATASGSLLKELKRPLPFSLSWKTAAYAGQFLDKDDPGLARWLPLYHDLGPSGIVTEALKLDALFADYTSVAHSGWQHSLQLIECLSALAYEQLHRVPEQLLTPNLLNELLNEDVPAVHLAGPFPNSSVLTLLGGALFPTGKAIAQSNHPRGLKMLDEGLSELALLCAVRVLASKNTKKGEQIQCEYVAERMGISENLELGEGENAPSDILNVLIQWQNHGVPEAAEKLLLATQRPSSPSSSSWWKGQCSALRVWLTKELRQPAEFERLAQTEVPYDAELWYHFAQKLSVDKLLPVGGCYSLPTESGCPSRETAVTALRAYSMSLRLGLVNEWMVTSAVVAIISLIKLVNASTTGTASHPEFDNDWVTQIPGRYWLPFLPVLMHLLTSCSSSILSQAFARCTLVKAGSVHPSEVVCHLLAFGEEEKTGGIWEEMNCQLEHGGSPKLVNHMREFLSGLQAISLTEEERWYAILKEAYTTLKTRFAGAYAYLKTQRSHFQNKKLFKLLSTEITWALEPVLLALKWQVQISSSTLQIKQQEAIQQVIQQLTNALESPDGSAPWLPGELESILQRPLRGLEAALSLFPQSVSDPGKPNMRSSGEGLNLKEVCPALLELVHPSHGLLIPMPGFSGANPDDERVDAGVYASSIVEKVPVLGTKTRPRKLSLVGSDLKKYEYLLKGRGDPRVDWFVCTFFRTVQSMALQNVDTSDVGCSIIPLRTTPVGRSTVLVDWIKDSSPLFSVYAGCDLKELARTSANLPGLAFNDRLAAGPKTMIADYLLYISVSPSDWWCRQKQYTVSLASSSVLGHLLGIGDRHLDNILVHAPTGGLFHVDFGILFDRGKSLTVPETVPFRLTQSMVYAAGPTGVLPGGWFRHHTDGLLQVVREDISVIASLLRIALDDLTIGWNPEDEDAVAKATIERFVTLKQQLVEQQHPRFERILRSNDRFADDSIASTVDTYLQRTYTAYSKVVEVLIKKRRLVATLAHRDEGDKASRSQTKNECRRDLLSAKQKIEDLASEVDSITSTIKACTEQCTALLERQNMLLSSFGDRSNLTGLGLGSTSTLTGLTDVGDLPPLGLINRCAETSDTEPCTLIGKCLGLVGPAASRAPLSPSTLLHAALTDDTGCRVLAERKHATDGLLTLINSYCRALDHLPEGCYGRQSICAKWLPILVTSGNEDDIEKMKHLLESQEINGQLKNEETLRLVWSHLKIQSSSLAAIVKELSQSLSSLHNARADGSIFLSSEGLNLKATILNMIIPSFTGQSAVEPEQGRLALQIWKESFDQQLSQLSEAAPNSNVLDLLQQLTCGFAESFKLVMEHGEVHEQSIMAAAYEATRASCEEMAVIGRAMGGIQLLVPELTADLHNSLFQTEGNCLQCERLREAKDAMLSVVRPFSSEEVTSMAVASGKSSGGEAIENLRVVESEVQRMLPVFIPIRQAFDNVISGGERTDSKLQAMLQDEEHSSHGYSYSMAEDTDASEKTSRVEFDGIDGVNDIRLASTIGQLLSSLINVVKSAKEAKRSDWKNWAGPEGWTAISTTLSASFVSSVQTYTVPWVRRMIHAVISWLEGALFPRHTEGDELAAVSLLTTTANNHSDLPSFFSDVDGFSHDVAGLNVSLEEDAEEVDPWREGEGSSNKSETQLASALVEYSKGAGLLAALDAALQTNDTLSRRASEMLLRVNADLGVLQWSFEPMLKKSETSVDDFGMVSPSGLGLAPSLVPSPAEVTVNALNKPKYLILDQIKTGIETLQSAQQAVEQWLASSESIRQRVCEELVANCPHLDLNLLLQSCLIAAQNWHVEATQRSHTMSQFGRGILEFEDFFDFELPSNVSMELKFKDLVTKKLKVLSLLSLATDEHNKLKEELEDLEARELQELSALKQAREEEATATFEASKIAIPFIKATKSLNKRLMTAVNIFLSLDDDDDDVMIQLQAWMRRVAVVQNDGRGKLSSEEYKATQIQAKHIVKLVETCIASLRDVPESFQNFKDVLKVVCDRLARGGRGEAAAIDQVIDIVKSMQPSVKQLERHLSDLVSSNIMDVEWDEFITRARHEMDSIPMDEIIDRMKYQATRETRLYPGSSLPQSLVVQVRDKFSRLAKRRGIAKLLGERWTIEGDGVRSTGSVEIVSVAEQMESLVNQATSVQNLSKMYEGWMAWV